ncbi:MAG: nickel pincer cofactor biosynthesis protein LarB [bacterium]|nr:nickel pincer cofactor biosynthesis protein LarB [bacterium]
MAESRGRVPVGPSISDDGADAPRIANGAGADPLAGIADLDLERAKRRGYPEAVFAEGKTVEQWRVIAAALRDAAGGAGVGSGAGEGVGSGAGADGAPAASPQASATLFTRVDPERAAAILGVLPDARHDPEARVVIWPAVPPPPSGGHVVVACAGTSDLPVAREAVLTAEYLGRRTTLIADVGVAGLHRIVKHLPALREAAAIVVVAGMDGALPSVVAGLVSTPVVACPTSVGYGAAFEGLAPLLSMLNACAPGVGVVNIDNGYGAGHLAAQIAAPRPDAPHPATQPSTTPGGDHD